MCRSRKSKLIILPACANQADNLVPLLLHVIKVGNLCFDGFVIGVFQLIDLIDLVINSLQDVLVAPIALLFVKVSLCFVHSLLIRYPDKALILIVDANRPAGLRLLQCVLEFG